MAHKVFVDLDEEITLAVEKVLKAEGNQIILVVPESAMLVNSLVSLKLLSRQIYKKNKMIVLVTEDKVGQQLSKKAGLVSVEKVSDVNGDVWKKALQLREDFKKGREKTKKMLVDKREEGENVEFEEEPEISEGEKSKGEDYFQGMPEKPRLEGKLTSIGGFPLYAGGDIKEDINVLKEVTTSEREALEARKQEEKEQSLREPLDRPEGSSKKVVGVLPEAEKVQAEEIEKKPTKTTSFVGRDLTSSTVGVEPTRRRVVGSAMSGLGGVGGGIIDKIKEFYSGEKGKKRIYYSIGGLVLLIIFLLGYFVFPEVTFNITLAEANVPVNETVKASLAQSSVDIETQTIPARRVEVKKETSKKAQSTGHGQSGHKAQGLATFYNKTASTIQLTTGTVLTAIDDASLKYTLTQNLSVQPMTCLPTCTLPEGTVQAASFGEKYNNPSSPRSYTVAGYTYSQLGVTSQTNQVQGGTTEDVVEISQADFDDLRNALTEELQGAMLGELDALVSDNEVKLDGTQKFSEPKVTSKNKVGDDVEEFEMTVELTGTMLVATENDLKDMANLLVKQKDKLEGEFEIKDISELEVGSATLSGDVASFNLRLQGNIKASIDEQVVRDAVRGKSYLDAVRIIKEMPDVKELAVDYSPEWMPIKRIPDDDAKIGVVFK